MSDIGLILELILKLLPIIKPSELEKIKKEIEKLEKEHEEKKQKFIKALETGNIAELNLLLSELLEL
jgi:formate dehydrogenase maturation protein FdhE